MSEQDPITTKENPMQQPDQTTGNRTSWPTVITKLSEASHDAIQALVALDSLTLTIASATDLAVVKREAAAYREALGFNPLVAEPGVVVKCACEAVPCRHTVSASPGHCRNALPHEPHLWEFQIGYSGMWTVRCDGSRL